METSIFEERDDDAPSSQAPRRTRTSQTMEFLRRRSLKAYGPTQYVSYLSGCFIFSFGANLFIFSKLGTDPLDVLSLGLKGTVGITVGTAQGGLAILFLAIWSAWNRRLPPVSPFITFALCGSLIDLWMYTQVAAYLPLTPYPMLFAGVFACAYGSALIVMSGIGIRPMDLLAITAHKKWKVPFWCCKGVLEVALLVSGWLLGGPVGIGTVVFLAFVGWLIQPLMWFNEVRFRIPNYGLPRQVPSAVSAVVGSS
jgi:uncharacterized membrane protein YczE